MQKLSACVKKAVKWERYLLLTLLLIIELALSELLSVTHLSDNSVSEVRFILGKSGLIKGNAL